MNFKKRIPDGLERERFDYGTSGTVIKLFEYLINQLHVYKS